MNNYIFYKNAPHLDLHGEDTINGKIKAEGFLLENYKLGKRVVCIVHGIGTGKLKITIHNLLKTNPYVESYQLDIFNPGLTMIELKKQE